MPNLKGKRVLIFGDSLSHYGSDSGPEIHEYAGPVTSSAPGAVLAGKLIERGAAATRTDARVSRSAVNFWSREDYNKLLKSDLAWDPDIVLVMLGTNDLHLNATADAKAMAGIRDVFKQAGIDVIAIGPPSFIHETSDHVYGTLTNVFGAVVDSRPLTLDLVEAGRARDGVHFTASGAELYADRLADELTRAATAKSETVAALGLGLALTLVGVLIGRQL